MTGSMCKRWIQMNLIHKAKPTMVCRSSIWGGESVIREKQVRDWDKVESGYGRMCGKVGCMAATVRCDRRQPESYWDNLTSPLPRIESSSATQHVLNPSRYLPQLYCIIVRFWTYLRFSDDEPGPGSSSPNRSRIKKSHDHTHQGNWVWVTGPSTASGILFIY